MGWKGFLTAGLLAAVLPGVCSAGPVRATNSSAGAGQSGVGGVAPSGLVAPADLGPGLALLPTPGLYESAIAQFQAQVAALPAEQLPPLLAGMQRAGPQAYDSMLDVAQRTGDVRVDMMFIRGSFEDQVTAAGLLARAAQYRLEELIDSLGSDPGSVGAVIGELERFQWALDAAFLERNGAVIEAAMKRVPSGTSETLGRKLDALSRALAGTSLALPAFLASAVLPGAAAVAAKAPAPLRQDQIPAEGRLRPAPEPVAPGSVGLRNGGRENAGVVAAAYMSIQALSHEDPVAFVELVMKARDPGHPLLPGVEKRLTALRLMRPGGEIHSSLRNVILSSAVGDGLDVGLVDPRVR